MMMSTTSRKITKKTTTSMTTRVSTTNDLATMGFTGAPKIKCTFFCISVRQKNAFHI